MQPQMLALGEVYACLRMAREVEYSRVPLRSPGLSTWLRIGGEQNSGMRYHRGITIVRVSVRCEHASSQSSHNPSE